LSDEPPPDYEIDWHGKRESTSFLGCVGVAIGGVFMLTGGMCAVQGLAGSSIGAVLVGLIIMAVGWKVMKG
jgi:hypothetical protein